MFGFQYGAKFPYSSKILADMILPMFPGDFLELGLELVNYAKQNT